MARLPYVSKADLSENHGQLIESSLQGRPLNVYAALGNNPAILVGLRRFFRSLWQHTGLDTRRRELVILAVAGALQNEYEWHQHARIAPNESVTRDELLALGKGRFDEFESSEARLLRYVIAVLDRSVTDNLHAAVAAEYDDETVVGIAALAAGYQLLGTLIEAFEIEPEEPFVGWQLEHGYPDG